MPSPLRDNYKYTYITSATTTQVLTGQGVLVRIVINKATTGAVSIIDDITGSTVNIGVIAASTPAQSIEYGVFCVKGIRIINASTEDITVVTSALPS